MKTLPKTLDIQNIPKKNNRRPQSLKEASIRTLEDGIFSAYVNEFMDEFYSQKDRVILFQMIEKEPLLLEDEKDNAYYGAIAEYLALIYDLEIPSWTEKSNRFLHEAWFPSGLKDYCLIHSPAAFRRRMIFVDENPLYRPRKEWSGIKVD